MSNFFEYQGKNKSPSKHLNSFDWLWNRGFPTSLGAIILPDDRYRYQRSDGNQSSCNKTNYGEQQHRGSEKTHRACDNAKDE
jgi:hypothetical protein